MAPETVNALRLESEISTIKKLLEQNGIDFSLWGKGEAKTVEHLAKEVLAGESELSVDEQGQLIRTLHVACADVSYRHQNGTIYTLKEVKQVFKDGRTRQRDLDVSLSEKITTSEDPRESVARGIEEELGISENFIIDDNEIITEKLRHSPSFPGLQSRYVTYRFDVTLNDSAFRPEGYIEHQHDKDTYFEWVKNSV